MTKDKVTRAGAIPYRIVNGVVTMMFMLPSDPMYGGDRFQIAKGKMDPGETIQQTAIREASEELGLFTSNIVSTHLVGEFLGRTTVYIVKIDDPNLFGVPSFETGDVAWLTMKEFNDVGRELHRPVVQAAFDLINKVENLR